MTTDHILTRQSIIDNLIFSLRGWLNWLTIQRWLVRENLRRWPASWAIDVLATVLVTVLLAPAWALYRLGAWVRGVTKIPDFRENKDSSLVIPKVTIVTEPEPYGTIPIGATALVLEIHTEPAALVICKNGAALEVEPAELMALAGALTVAGGGLPELMKTRGILWER
jgi:hypothetical protein